MARARNLKPGFFDNDDLAAIGPLGQLLFAGLWGIADRAGRLEDRPARIKAKVFPYYEADVDGLLDQLAAKGFVQRYEAEGVRYLQVINFGKHQNPHKNEPASTLPAPDEHHTSTVQEPEPQGSTPADSGLPLTDSGLLTAAPGRGAGAPAEPPTEQAPIHAAPKSKPRSRIGDWRPSELLIVWAEQELHVPKDFVAAETEKFRDHWLARGEAMADWAAAWRKWLRNAVDFAARDAGRAPIRANGRASPARRAEATEAYYATTTPEERQANIDRMLTERGWTQ